MCANLGKSYSQAHVNSKGIRLFCIAMGATLENGGIGATRFPNLFLKSFLTNWGGTWEAFGI